MRTIRLIVILIVLVLPRSGSAEIIYRTNTGTVTGFSGNQIIFKGNSAVNFAADPSTAQLVKRNGSPMMLSEILIGDKIEVNGIPWSDSSMTAKYIRNLSLYVHAGTFSGKIIAIDPPNSSFTIQSRANGIQSIHTDPVTTFKKGSKNSSFSALELGHTAMVKGVWDRAKAQVTTRSIVTTVRLVNIDIVGELRLKNGNSLTVIANNIIYGIDTSKAKLLNKKRKTISLDALQIGDTLEISGKHVAEYTRVTATSIKDLSIIK